MSEQQREQLWNLGFGSIKELETDQGILASGRHESYGCIFGRDSLITSLNLLSANRGAEREYFIALVRKILLNISELQGRAYNIESGEEPGKIIHEYRPDEHERLTLHAPRPWYVYEDGAMRNYDSADATPLYLMALYRYLRATGDTGLEDRLMPNVREALAWLLRKSDSRFIGYEFPPERKCGGLICQSWMDSGESLFFEQAEPGSRFPTYPIVPVEVQAYAWAALSMWADHLRETEPGLSVMLRERAAVLRERFNDAFILRARSSVSLAFAIDGEGRTLVSPRSSMGHVLWAAHEGRCILDERFVPAIVQRLMSDDLFVPSAGIRTLSRRSSRYDPHSYHNGSIWPHDTSMLAEGLDNFGYREEARKVRRALLRSYAHFSAPLELFAYSRGHREYEPASGQRACRVQAWSAAGLLATLSAAP